MKTNNPTHPPEPPPQSLYQRLGWLRLLKPSASIICVKNCGVELILPCGLSARIPAHEIRTLLFKTNSQFADCLEAGADFPSLQLSLQATEDFRPLWADEPNEGAFSPGTAAAAGAGAAAGAAATVGRSAPAAIAPAAPAPADESLPLPSFQWGPRYGGDSGISR